MFEAVIFDYARTIADSKKVTLLPGAEEVLIFFRQKVPKMGLVSRGQNVAERHADFKRLGLGRFFDVFDVVGESGTKNFSKFLKELGVDEAEKCLVIGDRIKSEIVEGNKSGCVTIWVRQGKFKDELPDQGIEKPDFTVSSLQELPMLFEKINSSLQI